MSASKGADDAHNRDLFPDGRVSLLKETDSCSLVVVKRGVKGAPVVSQGDRDLEQFWVLEETRRLLDQWIEAALEEDRAKDDGTSVLFDDPQVRARAVVSSRQRGVVCGTLAMSAVFEQLDSKCQTVRRIFDGDTISDGSEVMVVDGPLPVLLAGERTALNIGAFLCGIATRTSAMVRAAGAAMVFDTRKTLPGLRQFQKQAVRAGGGVSHRSHLGQFPMVKENHREWIQRGHPELANDSAAEIAFILERLRSSSDAQPIAIEVEDEPSFRACLEQHVELILIDNTDPETLSQWIQRARADHLDVTPSRLEASGGIDEGSVASHVAAGIGRISCGAITHSAPALDLSMQIIEVPRS